MMTEIPDIVKIMRVEEHFRQFQQKASQAFKEGSSTESDKTVCFMDDEDILSTRGRALEDNQILEERPQEPNETYEELKKKYIKTIEELKESRQKFNALAEYFETLTDKTITYGKRDLFSDVSDIIFQITPTGRITYINSAIEKIAGYKSEEMIGSNIETLLPHKDWKTVQKIFFSRFGKTSIMERELSNFETTLLCKDGRTVHVEINGKPLDRRIEVIGKKPQIRIQGSIRDITERIQAEDERRRHAEHLRTVNQELTTTNEELKRTQDELQLLNEGLENKVKERTVEIELLLKRKDEFITQLGHDLKSPLTPLIGLLPIVLENEQDPRLEELLQVINRNIRYMRDLVVKTLQLERLNSPATMLNVDTVNLFQLTNDVIQTKRFSFEEKHITVDTKIDDTLLLQADPVQLKELFDNLLTNAIKFTPDSGHIIIDAKKEKNIVKISIADSGIGMTSEQIDRIFETFYKVDPARHDLESSGLGLPICKRIVEKHGGAIWIESDGLGKGTAVFFTIPKASIISEKSN